MSKDRFISEAAEIAKRLGYTTVVQLIGNEQFRSKLDSWNNHNKWNQTLINVNDIIDKIKGIDEESNKTKTPSE